jgi:hypothetical protein
MFKAPLSLGLVAQDARLRGALKHALPPTPDSTGARHYAPHVVVLRVIAPVVLCGLVVYLHLALPLLCPVYTALLKSLYSLLGACKNTRPPSTTQKRQPPTQESSPPTAMDWPPWCRCLQRSVASCMHSHASVLHDNYIPQPNPTALLRTRENKTALLRTRATVVPCLLALLLCV